MLLSWGFCYVFSGRLYDTCKLGAGVANFPGGNSGKFGSSDGCKNLVIGNTILGDDALSLVSKIMMICYILIFKLRRHSERFRLCFHRISSVNVLYEVSILS